MQYKFTLVRKLNKESFPVKGLSLRSIKGDPDSCLMVLLSPSYGAIKSAAESFRMQTNCSISSRSRGKALEVSTSVSVYKDALATMFDFASGLAFSSDDTSEIIEFLSKYMPLSSYGCSLASIDVDQSQLTLEMNAELDIPEDAGEDEIALVSEQLLSSFMPLLDRYSVGVIK